MDTLVGQQLGKYEIQSELGHGGMGIVYKGYDAALRRPVAIKVLPAQLTYDAQFVQRFQQEAILAASLRHPNIVTIYDVGQQGGIYYIVMEYLEGTTLEALLTRHGPMEADQAAHILRQLADALDYAHSQGIIHRDVKPANIMVGPGGRATLMDFGLVRAAEGTNLTRTGTYLGTPEYMSPEQAMGQQVEAASDTYSLGVVLYKMLSGKVPFSRSTPLGVTYAHVNEPPPLLRKVRAGISPGIEAVVNKALAKNPADRYRTAALLVEDFAVAASGAAPTALRTPPPAAGIPRSGVPEPEPSEPGQTVLVPKRAQAQRTSGPRPRGLSVALAGILAALLMVVALLLYLAFGTGKAAPSTERTSATTGSAVVVASAQPPSSGTRSTPALQPANLEPKAPSGQPGTAAPTETPAPVAAARLQPTATAVVSQPLAQSTATTAPTLQPANLQPGTPTRPNARARVANEQVNLRGGPGTGYAVVGQARQGDTLPITAKSSDGAWWQICCVEEQPAWITAQMVAVEGDTGSVPVAQNIPTPPPAAPSGQCKPWHKKPAPGYGIILIENHMGEELSADYAVGGTGHWMIAPKKGEEPGRWWKEVPIGEHVISYSTSNGYGRASFHVESGKSYVSPLWYNDRADDFVFPMDIPAGCQ